MNGGGVKCWGYNNFGQLGIGSMGDQYSPVDVPGSKIVASGIKWQALFQLENYMLSDTK